MSTENSSRTNIPKTTASEIKNHRDLIVWQKAMDLVEIVYSLSSEFPKTETYGLTSQTRRAVSSVPANIAEGQGRRLRGEFLNFLGNARGSLWELDTHLEVALRLRYLTNEQYELVNRQLLDVARLLNGLMRSLR
jgi:four helix bundle protein